MGLSEVFKMKQYTVQYKLHRNDEIRQIVTSAKNKEDAYVQATFYDIPYQTGEQPYSSWVHAVTHNNGNYQIFNTFEGKPY